MTKHLIATSSSVLHDVVLARLLQLLVLVSQEIEELAAACLEHASERQLDQRRGDAVAEAHAEERGVLGLQQAVEDRLVVDRPQARQREGSQAGVSGAEEEELGGLGR